MPASISSTRVVGTDAKGYSATVNRCDTLAELVDLVPAPFRPRTQDLVNQIYKAAVKSNHARSYLATLERHKQDGTFPPEIGGRIHNPTLQISKEYTAAAECKASLAGLDTSTRAHKTAMLASAISLKNAEVSYLQGLFAETAYKSASQAIYTDVVEQLASDAALEAAPDGSIPEKEMPPWMADDCAIYKGAALLYPQRAIAIAYATVQRETSKKFKALSLKQRTDEDVEMQDATSKSETVQALITKNLEQFKKEFKLQNPGNGKKKPKGKANPKNKKPNGNLNRQTLKVTKPGMGKGKGKGGKKNQGKSQN